MKEMGLGHRYDKLDNQFARHNWHKVTRLGAGLYRKLERAEMKCMKHVPAHEAFTAILPDENLASMWTKEVKDWECNPELPTPYYVADTHASQAAVALALQEDKRLASAEIKKINNTMPSVCISLGLEIE
ncbi:hypothetical protein EV421DRAFT_1910691 [Armillaria borealis]|uniref:Uncharacterized protein n=1 Tax=Armillaria borealis TaxID=47425 RepID=A0AA39IYA0_9AGAR|nr:hypothetical protein EV421DRAFT_1910691 [Armillaria borealis]